MRSAVEVLAPAKINLTLHVVGRRSDGYHLLDSLVVFADLGDSLVLSRATRTALRVDGPFATSVPAGGDNLVMRAAELAGVAVEMSLCKMLPVGAGIGGGSSDAGAALRAIAAMTGRAVPSALTLGADVPVCAVGRPARMRGVGDALVPMPGLPELPVVLVFPGVPVSTAAAFSGLERADGAPMPEAIPRWRDARDAADWLGRQRNDMEAAAIRLAPAVADARATLQAQDHCLLSRMSGSGSTVFGLFERRHDAERAARRIAGAHPGWWVRASRVLTAAPAVQERRLTT